MGLSLRRFVYRYILTPKGWVEMPVKCPECGDPVGDWERDVFEGVCSQCYVAME